MNALAFYTVWLMRKHMRTAMIWTISLTLYVAMMVLIYPTFVNTGIFDVVQNYPEGMKRMLNIDEMTSLAGFLNFEILTFVPLVLAFFPIMHLAGAIAGEEERGALDIYLAQPISRSNMVLANVITIAVWSMVMLLGAGTLNWLLAQILDQQLGLGQVIQGFLGVFPVIFVFGCLALLVGSVVRTKGAASGTAFLVMFVLYLVEMIGKLVPDYDKFRPISPFYWYGEPILNGLNRTGTAYLLAACLLLIIAAMAAFNRRDIYT